MSGLKRGNNRGTKTNPNALYFVTLRDAERKLLKEALDYHDWNAAAAATMLGVSRTQILFRSRVLGGVFDNDPRHEPFDYQERMEAIRKQRERARNAKRRYKPTEAQNEPDHPSQPADETNGAADHLDRVEDGDVDSAVGE